MNTVERTTPPEDGPDCRICRDTGVMTWQQPVQRPDSGWEMREVSHPCTCAAARAAGTWRHPAAEQNLVVDVPDHQAATNAAPPPTRAHGHADAAQELPDALAALIQAAIRRAEGHID